MARRAKTVIGGGEKEQSRLMMQAAESGHNAKARAHSQLLDQQDKGIRYGMQSAQTLGGLVDRAESRASQEGMQEKSLQQQRDIEAERQGLQRDIETGRQAQAQERIDLEAADRGLERTGGGPENPMLQERQARLDAEMDQGAQQTSTMSPEEQQNLQDQGKKPMSMDGPYGTFRQSEELKQQKRRRATMEEQKIKIAQQNADANMMNAQRNYLKLRSGGGKAAPGSDEYKKELEKFSKSMIKSMDETRSIVTDLQLGKVDPMNVVAANTDNPNMEEIYNQVKDGGEITTEQRQRVVQFLRNKLGTQGVQYAAATGYMPPGMEPDNPIVKQYNDSFQKIASSFRSLQENQTLTGIQGAGQDLQGTFTQGELQGYSNAWRGMNSYEERNQFLGRVTANAMIEMQAIQAMQAAAPQPQGMQQLLQDQTQQIQQLQMQLQAMQEAMNQSNVDPRNRADAAAAAGRGARAAGGSPSDALRASQGVDPTAQRDTGGQPQPGQITRTGGPGYY